MERNIDRKTLSFGKGITNVPSDLLCEDSELTESDGFIFKDGEMKPIRRPVIIGNIPYKIMYAHKMADYENIIAYDNGKTIYTYPVVNEKISTAYAQKFDVGEVRDIKSVGNSLVLATSEGLYYLLYKNNKYIALGNKLPEPKCAIRLVDSKSEIMKDVICNIGSFVTHGTFDALYNKDTGILYDIVKKDQFGNNDYNKRDYHNYGKIADRETDFDNAIQGCIGAVRNKIKEKNRFCFPFFVRYALKLYDGTYTKISNPILCYPTTSENCKFVPVHIGDNNYITAEEYNWTDYFQYMPYSSALEMTATIENAEGWKDIIQGVTIFATDEVTPYKPECKWEFTSAVDTHGKAWAKFPNYEDEKFYWTYSTIARVVLQPKEKRTEKEIIDALLEKTVFYKLCDIDLDEEKGVIKDHVVSNLTTQEQLKVDDYYSWAHTGADKLYPYNGRLNMFGMYRYPWKGFSVFSEGQARNGKYHCKKVYVHIESSTMDAWVRTDTDMGEHFIDTWFYYPDPNATEVIFVYKMDTGDGCYKVKLKKHKRLNGAYCFDNLANYGLINAYWIPNMEYKDLPEVDEAAHEILDSQIYTSVVNNPYNFEASGDNTVGTGVILGIESNTEAISQGQFGQYPLIVFTSEGIYGMSVSSEGLYSSIHPMSREVCNKNSPFIPTDRLVFFTSKKGLMATSGSTAQCVSDRMRGKTPTNFASVQEKFVDFLAGDCLIAYDYQESLLFIFCKDKKYQYVYNMTDGTFSMIGSGILAQSVVNDYPDNLIQGMDGNVYSLLRKPNINDDEMAYSGHFATRPLKLGGSMTLKSIRAIKHLYDTDEGKVKLEVYGSNDCKNWQKLASLGGKPWKYFTFKYALKDFKAVDSFTGSIVEIQSRREDKIR